MKKGKKNVFNKHSFKEKRDSCTTLFGKKIKNAGMYKINLMSAVTCS